MVWMGYLGWISNAISWTWKKVIGAPKWTQMILIGMGIAIGKFLINVIAAMIRKKVTFVEGKIDSPPVDGDALLEQHGGLLERQRTNSLRQAGQDPGGNQGHNAYSNESSNTCFLRQRRGGPSGPRREGGNRRG